LIISFAFCVGVKLNFKDVEILVFLAFARMVGFQIGRPSYSSFISSLSITKIHQQSLLDRLTVPLSHSPPLINQIPVACLLPELTAVGLLSRDPRPLSKRTTAKKKPQILRHAGWPYLVPVACQVPMAVLDLSLNVRVASKLPFRWLPAQVRRLGASRSILEIPPLRVVSLAHARDSSPLTVSFQWRKIPLGLKLSLDLRLHRLSSWHGKSPAELIHQRSLVC